MFYLDGMIDANELSIVMNILKFPITDREAKDMIEFADHDKGKYILFYCLIKYLLDYTSQIKIKKNYLDPLKKLPSILFRSLTRWQIQIIRILCIIISINI